jgi:hypothetical protein
VDDENALPSPRLADGAGLPAMDGHQLIALHLGALFRTAGPRSLPADLLAWLIEVGTGKLVLEPQDGVLHHELAVRTVECDISFADVNQRAIMLTSNQPSAWVYDNITRYLT